jgi:hypothetical protein
MNQRTAKSRGSACDADIRAEVHATRGRFHPFRHFPELHQSVRAATMQFQEVSPPVNNAMEHKVHSFYRERFIETMKKRSKNAVATSRRPISAHSEIPPRLNAAKIFTLKNKMASLCGSSFEDVQGLNIVRRAIFKETSAIHKSMMDVQGVHARPKTAMSAHIRVRNNDNGISNSR